MLKKNIIPPKLLLSVSAMSSYCQHCQIKAMAEWRGGIVTTCHLKAMEWQDFFN